MIRIGNEEYERENRSFGLTTMQTKHADLEGNRIRFVYRAKGGKNHQVTVRSHRLVRVIRRCQELPGQRLFQYLDDQQNPHPINSEDVNEYIRDATDGDFTAKDFRTWAGTFLTAISLRESEPPQTSAEAKKILFRRSNSPQKTRKPTGNLPKILCSSGTDRVLPEWRFSRVVKKATK